MKWSQLWTNTAPPRSSNTLTTSTISTTWGSRAGARWPPHRRRTRRCSGRGLRGEGGESTGPAAAAGSRGAAGSKRLSCRLKRWTRRSCRTKRRRGSSSSRSCRNRRTMRPARAHSRHNCRECGGRRTSVIMMRSRQLKWRQLSSYLSRIVRSRRRSWGRPHATSNLA